MPSDPDTLGRVSTQGALAGSKSALLQTEATISASVCPLWETRPSAGLVHL